MILYVTEPGSSIKKKLGRYIIEKENQILSEIPMENLDSIVMYSGTNITTPCINSFLEKGIDVIYANGNGKFKGRLINSDFYNIERQFKQFEFYNNNAFSLQLAKKIIVAKIHNSKVVLQRVNKNAIDKIAFLKNLKNDAMCSENFDYLRGIEGIAAKEYFLGISEILPYDFNFNKRINFKANDKFNVLLNFGYSLLRNDIYNMVISKGLNPYIGFFHRIRNGHDALVSDLMEEFRAYVIDNLILKIVKNYSFSDDDFIFDTSKNLFISKTLKKFIINEYEKIMEKQQDYSSYSDNKISLRFAIFKQIENFIKSLSFDDTELYLPFKIR